MDQDGGGKIGHWWRAGERLLSGQQMSCYFFQMEDQRYDGVNLG